MENVDYWLDLLTKHKVIIFALLSFLMWGGYLTARHRTSGMKKLLAAHSEIFDDLNGRLGKLRMELDNTRQELSIARAKGYEADAEVVRLSFRVQSLEAREAELISEIQKYQNVQLDN